MIVFLHVVIALASIVATSYAYIRPSGTKLRVSYSLVGLTIASGVYLTWSAPAHMIEACTVGLVYLGIVLLGIVLARHKLALLELQQDTTSL